MTNNVLTFTYVLSYITIFIEISVVESQAVYPKDETCDRNGYRTLDEVRNVLYSKVERYAQRLADQNKILAEQNNLLERQVQLLRTNQELNRSKSDETVKCMDKWISFETKCFFFSMDLELTWEDALNYCLSNNSRLAVPINSMDNNFVKGMSRQLHKEGDSNPVFSVWIGIYYDKKEGKWMISPDMVPLGKTFSDWAPGEPSRKYRGDGEECGSLRGYVDYQWNDVNCLRNYPFICEQILSSD